MEMTDVKKNSYAEAPIFAIGGEYLGKDGERMQNYGVSLNGFVNWYLREYPECTGYGCSAFYTYVHSSEYGSAPHYSCCKTVLQELFPQPDGQPRLYLEDWMGYIGGEENKARRKYMERILARPDRILVCPCFVL